MYAFWQSARNIFYFFMSILTCRRLLSFISVSCSPFLYSKRGASKNLIFAEMSAKGGGVDSQSANVGRKCKLFCENNRWETKKVLLTKMSTKVGREGVQSLRTCLRKSVGSFTPFLRRPATECVFITFSVCQNVRINNNLQSKDAQKLKTTHFSQNV